MSTSNALTRQINDNGRQVFLTCYGIVFIFNEGSLLSLGIPVDDPAYFLLYRQQYSDFQLYKQREHDRYTRSLKAILTWGQAPEAATLKAKEALAILEQEKKSQSIAKFWENVASVEDQRMAAIAKRRVVVEEHTTNVTQSVFQQDQFIRDKYARHLADDLYQESDDDFMPIRKQKRKKLSLSKVSIRA
ncbi:186_t:CDS:2 [Paraglomus occultum]|uniref:186_t:CDS:1 n=1 Tax=Paraglomus occultum TaxID=144539 RepID=A0A9N9CM58_9GLOM|nr:186_t:CDS:2 [Paraglomus occultum]